ncbi:MAG TPA: SRPBCC family protein [Casimicrobiaceae bacterium]|nr:SRPBCC family protein [Casimicrobiaceae bacterium]
MRSLFRAVIRVTRSAILDAPIERVWSVLRDFNSHTAWHPIVAESTIERGEPSDQVGCVRNFTLHDGHHIREQLLTLSDRDHVSTYCILDATIPMKRYVATATLKRVTDGERTFWHWESTFEPPRGREQEFAKLVGEGVYEGGFAGLRAYLQRPLAVKSSVSVRGDSLPARGIIVSRHGGADVLQTAMLSAPPPGPGQVRIRQTAIGINYIDIYVRSGRYPLITPPAPLGMEAAGTVTDVGNGVAHLLPGDRVAYVAPQPGAYVDVRTLDASHVIALPHDIDDEVAATLMLKGLTAEYLLHRAHRVRPGDTLLVHAAAGALGGFLCAWGKALGARIIGTVSTAEKARVARDNGCDVPIVAVDGAFVDAVLSATGGRGVDVIYDGLGGVSHEQNLRSLAMLGHWIRHGQAGGAPSPINPGELSSKSVTLSSPVLFHYTASRERYETMAANTFDAYRKGILKMQRRHRYSLSAAADAHRQLEGRETTGPLILVP